jgi:2,4-didehydro-3-deoxy-L-rhamnonate hydrolase
MTIHVCRFTYRDVTQWGIVRKDKLIPIAGTFATTGDFIRNAVADLASLSEESIDLSKVKILSPVTSNQQFLCQGANYRQHMIESGMNPDEKIYNMIFTKASSCIVAADSDLVRPRHVQFLDYEIELGLIIKKDIDTPQQVTDVNLHEYVAGIVIVNDYSARDIQIPQTQFYKGKSYRTFGPVGPYVCLLEREDMPRLKDLELRLSVDGELRQHDNTRNLVYGAAETLSELSHIQNLYAGDLLATGTPAGCALQVPSPAKQRLAALLPERTKWELFLKIQSRRRQYLKPGDVVEASICSTDGVINLGMQSNRVIEEI